MCYGDGMATRIPLRELKNQCSAIVRRAEAGEEFEVTVAGRPCARLTSLVPVGPRERVPVGDLLAGLDELPVDVTLREELDVGLDWIDDDPFARAGL